MAVLKVKLRSDVNLINLKSLSTYLYTDAKITTLIVGRICGKYKMECGFGGKSTKIGTVDVKEVLNDFRYSAKLNFFPGVLKMTKSKMATYRSVTI